MARLGVWRAGCSNGPAARDVWLAAAAAWRSTMAASENEAQRLELEYVELANPVCARKIRRLLKYGEIDAAKTADELSTEAAVPLGRSIPRPEEPRHARYAATRTPLAHCKCVRNVTETREWLADIRPSRDRRCASRDDGHRYHDRSQGNYRDSLRSDRGARGTRSDWVGNTRHSRGTCRSPRVLGQASRNIARACQQDVALKRLLYPGRHNRLPPRATKTSAAPRIGGKDDGGGARDTGWAGEKCGVMAYGQARAARDAHDISGNEVARDSFSVFHTSGRN
jgi:hypothetical protein